MTAKSKKAIKPVIKAGTVRITARHDYLRVAKSGRKWVTPAFVVQMAVSRGSDDAALPRVGYTASKKVGNAVKRSRARRRLKAVAASHLNALALKGHDYVLIARASVLTCPYAKLEKDLAWALAKLAENADLKHMVNKLTQKN